MVQLYKSVIFALQKYYRYRSSAYYYFVKNIEYQSKPTGNNKLQRIHVLKKYTCYASHLTFPKILTDN